MTRQRDCVFSKTLDSYTAEMPNANLISREQEIELWEKIQQGDESARDKLVIANLRFVVSIARTYQGKGLSLEELISAGNMGLVQASHRFDGTKGIKFISYAVWWIRQAILKELSEQTRFIRLPMYKVDFLQKIRIFSRKILEETGHWPSIEDLCDRFDSSKDEIIEILIAGQNMQSLDGQDALSIDENSGGNKSLHDVLHDGGLDPYEEVEAGDSREALIKILDIELDEREKKIIILYFGINEIMLNLDEIGRIFYLSRERVRQIRDIALSKLRRSKFSCILLDLLDAEKMRKEKELEFHGIFNIN